METVYEQLGELRGKLVGLRWQLRHLAIEMDILAKEMTLQENPFAGMTCRAFRELERMAEELNPLYEDVMKELGARDGVTPGDAEHPDPEHLAEIQEDRAFDRRRGF